MELQLSKGFVTQIDDEDYSGEVAKYSWCAIQKKKGAPYYAARTRLLNGKRVACTLHRVIMKVTDPKVFVDHINGDTLDNRKCNLRLCSNRQNTFNSKRHKDAKCRFKGITYDARRKKYVAMIRFKGKNLNLGGYTSDTEAAKVYDAKATELFGEFACTNLKLGLYDAE